MKHAKWFTHHRSLSLTGFVLLAGLLPASPYAEVTVPDTQAANTQSYSLWGSVGKVEESDTQPVELGVKFRTDVDGSVSAVRFFRAVPVDSGYTVHVWSAIGELLGTGAAFEGH